VIGIETRRFRGRTLLRTTRSPEVEYLVPEGGSVELVRRGNRTWLEEDGLPVRPVKEDDENCLRQKR